MEIKVAGKYAISKKIGSGSFGEIYVGYNIETGEEVAVKLEPLKAKTMQLIYEAKIIKCLDNGGKGIPKIHWYGTDGDYNVMVMQLLGKSLEEIFTICGRRFTLKTALMVGEQILDRLEYIHSKSFIHRDIKPDNFLIGLNESSNTIFAVDFGLAKRYRNPKTKVHIPYKAGKSLTGTARYASINTHAGIEQSRRDDLEGMCYVLLYFLRGTLPWQGLTAKTRAGKYQKVMENKQSCAVEVLCKGFPSGFQNILKHVRGLGFEDEPNYEYIRKEIQRMYRHDSLTNDGNFDWIGKVDRGGKKSGYNGKTAKKMLAVPESKKETAATKKEEDDGKCSLL